MEKDEAREKAIERFDARRVPNCLDYDEVFNAALSEVFDAGYSAAQPQWKRISVEADLPQESGNYTWWHKSLGYPVLQTFDPATDRAAGFVETYAAYLPLPEYTGEV